MKNIYAQLLTLCCLLLMATGAFAQPGVLDHTFGNNGKVTIPVPIGAAMHPVDIKIQPDQKILILTRVDTVKANSNGQGDDYFWMYKLLRFKPDGTPDSSFAVNGSTPVVYYERPTNMELLANGQILLNTARQSKTNPLYGFWGWVDFCLTRYHANGSIDNTFGINGRAITRIDTSISIAMSMFVLPNGKIVQAGVAYVPYQFTIPSYNVLVGYDQNGNIDPTFGNNGKVKVATNKNYNSYYFPDDNSLTNPQTFVMLSNQKIVATADSGLYRFNSNGSVDATFGTNGFVYYPQRYISSNNNFYATFTGLVEPNNKMIFLSRMTPNPPKYPLKAFRFNADGSLDTTFNSFIDDDFAGASSYGNQFGKIFLEPNGQYSLALGLFGYGLGPSFLARINSNGSMDSTYGKRGKISFYNNYNYPQNSFYMKGNAAALQQDGKMVVGGVADTSTNFGYSQNVWVLARYEKNAKVKYNTLVSDIFYDQNANGIKDANETPFMGQQSTTTIKTGRTDTAYWYGQWPTYKANLYDVDTGSYRTSVRLYDQPYYTVAPVVKTTNRSTYWNTDTLKFAVQPIANIRDLAVTLIPLNKARPGFAIDYLIKVYNAGTDSAGNIKVKLVKSNNFVFDSANIAVSSIVADTITWNLGGLKSQHDAFIIVHGRVKAPPVVNIGDLLKSVASVTSDRTDTLAANDTSALWQVASGAYDPNDKAENHGGKIALSKVKAGEYLTYTIRFQNNGNDTAFNVYIRDTMDSKLDWSSLQILASSHNYKMTMNDGKCLFSFPFIMLVDSIKNEPLSHGYIVYKIKAKPTVQLGDVIKNTAAIYFDYNLPIITNTETTTIVADVLPLKLLSFTAKKENKTNLLNWKTTAEVNVSHFEIERSNNPNSSVGTGGREFSKIGTVKAGQTQYSFTDEKLLRRSTNYYRLKMIDIDGKYTYSPIRMISNNSSFYVNIYPNPAKDYLQVQIESEKKADIQLLVLSADGKVILSKSIKAHEGSSLQSINISTLPKGSYLLKVKGDNVQQVVKFEKL